MGSPLGHSTVTSHIAYTVCSNSNEIEMSKLWKRYCRDRTAESGWTACPPTAYRLRLHVVALPTRDRHSFTFVALVAGTKQIINKNK